jgi:hypothetical protein
MEKTMIPMPQVEKTAVVTAKSIYQFGKIGKGRTENEQWPGIALRRAMRAILKPPSRTTRASTPYVILDFSSFSPRERQHHLKAL